MAEPKVRFRQKDGSSYPAWKELPLGALVTENLDPVPTPKEGYRRVGIYCHAKGTFQEEVAAEKVLDVDKMYRIHKDNLIVNITFAWEHAVAIVKPEDEGLLVSHRFPEYSFNQGQIPSFYKYLVLRPYFRDQLSLASPGGAGRNRVLNKAQFKKIPINVPCEEEQRLVADFLSSVDEVITASEKEVANLETQKKAVMKKIFSQEVRFRKPDGSCFPEWKEQHLGDYCSFYNGDRSSKYPSAADYVEFGLPFINAGDLDGRLISSGCAKISAEKYNQLGGAKLRKNDILYCLRGSLGKMGIVDFETGGTVASSLVAIRCDKIEYLYVYFFLGSHLEYTQRQRNDEGAAQPNLSAKNLSNYVLPVPCLEEQRLIADFLSEFDEAISAAKKELELWKELKKGLLQQMFV